MNTTRFLLIRHGETDDLNRRLSGRSPGITLNETGRAQALNLILRLASVPVDAVYSSPLERARQTAEPLAGIHNLECHPDDAFNEIDYGEWTGCCFEMLQKLHTFHAYNTQRSITRIPGGEMMAEAQARMIAGLEHLHFGYPDQTVAVISHADMIRSAIAYAAGISIDHMLRIEISPASVSMLTVSSETFLIEGVNIRGKIIESE